MLTDVQTAETKRRSRILWIAGCASLLLAVATLAVTGWVVYRNWAEASAESKLVQSNRDYLRSINSLLSAVDDADTGQRGYVLTGREHYLELYNRALPRLKKSLGALQSIEISRPDQKETINRLDGLVGSEVAELAKTIELRRTQGVDAASVAVSSDKGMKQMEEIRTICGTAADAQRRFVTSESGISAEHQIAAIELSAGGGVLLLGLMIAGLVALNSGAKQQTLLAERLAHSREMFETTLTSIGDGVIATDTKGEITFINPEAVRLTGWPREQAVGKPLTEVFQIVNETTRRTLESPHEKVMRNGSAVGLANHTLLIRPDGSEVPIDDSGAPIRNAYSVVSGVVLVFRDVSDRRKAEAALQQSHDEVLKANEELRQFSYAATHDLQEPLRTIVVFSQLLGRNHKEALTAQGQHLLLTVEEAAVRMSTLIEHLLAYTRVGGMDSTTARVALEPADVLDDTLTQLKGAIEEAKAVITHGPLPRVWSDPAQLSQVFQNLISNSIKYRRANVPPEIHVSASITGDLATFQVVDNGMGFKQEYSDRIFLLFQRLHGRTIPGTGIGLALCRRIIERQGGRIWVKSEENKGSSFYFTLPLAQHQSANSGAM